MRLDMYILGITLGTWLYCLFGLPALVKREARETRRLLIELATAQAVSRSRGPLHTYAVNLEDDTLCVTNVVDDGKVVWERGKTEAR